MTDQPGENISRSATCPPPSRLPPRLERRFTGRGGWPRKPAQHGCRALLDGVTNRCSPASALVHPFATSRATSRSVGVSAAPADLRASPLTPAARSSRAGDRTRAAMRSLGFRFTRRGELRFHPRIGTRTPPATPRLCRRSSQRGVEADADLRPMCGVDHSGREQPLLDRSRASNESLLTRLRRSSSSSNDSG